MDKTMLAMRGPSDRYRLAMLLLPPRFLFLQLCVVWTFLGPGVLKRLQLIWLRNQYEGIFSENEKGLEVKIKTAHNTSLTMISYCQER